MTDQLQNPWVPPGTSPAASTTDQPSGPVSNTPAAPSAAVPTTQPYDRPAQLVVADPISAPIPDADPPVPTQR